jgi:hypothetical protein
MGMSFATRAPPLWNSVRAPPGSIIVMPIPKDATSCATDSRTAYRPSSRPPRVSLACAMRSTQRGIWVPRRASELSPRVLTLIFAHIPEERWKLGNAARWCD